MDTKNSSRLSRKYRSLGAQTRCSCSSVPQRVVLRRSEQPRTAVAALQDTASRIASEHYATIRAAQDAEIKAHLARFAAIRRQEEERLTTSFKQRDKQLWENVEAVIKQEENKVRQTWEASERVRQEEARKKAEDDARVKEQQEQMRKAEAAATERARLQAEAAAKRKEDERKAAELIQQTEKAQAAAVEQRNQVGQTTALDDWTVGRTFLHVSLPLFSCVPMFCIDLSTANQGRDYAVCQVDLATSNSLQWTAAQDNCQDWTNYERRDGHSRHCGYRFDCDWSPNSLHT